MLQDVDSLFSAIDELDALPPEAEMRYRRQLAVLGERAAGVVVPPELEARWSRYRSRLAEMAGAPDSLDWAQRSLRAAAAHEQWSEMEMTLDYLRQLDGGEPSLTAHPEALEKLTRGVLRLARCRTQAELRAAHLEQVLEWMNLGQISWHEKRDGRWAVLDWRPTGQVPRVSQSVLDRCAESQRILFGPAAELPVSHSLAQSDRPFVLALPVPRGERTLAVLYSGGDGAAEADLRLLEFLSSLSAVVLERIQAEESRAQASAQVEVLHRRWREVMALSPAGLAILDEEGRMLDCNAAYTRLCPPSEPPLPIREGPRLLHLRYPSRWLQVTDSSLELRGCTMRTVLDLTGEEPGRWLQFLEEGRHMLAADLHDGPAQVGALRNLQGLPLPAGTLETIVRRLSLLRSPWVEGKDPASLFQQACRLVPPGCECELVWNIPEDASDTPQARTMFRILQAVLEDLVAGSAPLLGVYGQIEPGRAELVWTGGLDFARALDPTTRLWLEARLEVVGGRLSSTERGMTLQFD